MDREHFVQQWIIKQLKVWVCTSSSKAAWGFFEERQVAEHLMTRIWEVTAKDHFLACISYIVYKHLQDSCGICITSSSR